MARVRRYLGRVEVWLDRRERAAVLAVVDALSTGDDAGPWLEPAAYEDPELESEHRRLTSEERAAVHAADLAVLREDLARGDDRCRLDEDRALTWLRAINRLRLVAGTRLGISDDGWETALTPAQRSRDELAMLGDLGWLQEGIIEALER